jgi:hypothetical protein
VKSNVQGKPVAEACNLQRSSTSRVSNPNGFRRPSGSLFSDQKVKTFC